MKRLVLPLAVATFMHVGLLASDFLPMDHTVVPRVTTRVIRMHLMSRKPNPVPSTPTTSLAPMPEQSAVENKSAAPTKPIEKSLPKPAERTPRGASRSKKEVTPNTRKAPKPSTKPMKQETKPQLPAVDKPLPEIIPIDPSTQTPAVDAMASLGRPPEIQPFVKTRQLAPHGQGDGRQKSKTVMEDHGAEQATIDQKAIPLYHVNPPPTYPRLARVRGYEGGVMLDVLVGTDGLVQELKVHQSSGYPILDRQAVQTVRKWRFKPAMQGSRPIAMRVRVPMSFKLH